MEGQEASRTKGRPQALSLGALSSVSRLVECERVPSPLLTPSSLSGFFNGVRTIVPFRDWVSEQEYIRKSNNTSAQQSVNAARAANEGAKGDDGSDEEDDESEGANSQPNSKRSSLVLGKPPDAEMPVFSEDMAEKTPTAAAMLSQAQAQAQRANAFPGYAPIRRQTPQDGLAGSSRASPSLVPAGPAPPMVAQSQPVSEDESKKPATNGVRRQRAASRSQRDKETKEPEEPETEQPEVATRRKSRSERQKGDGE